MFDATTRREFLVTASRSSKDRKGAISSIPSPDVKLTTGRRAELLSRTLARSTCEPARPSRLDERREQREERDT